jgi:macrodomain Ter protein organizer (MatP/YcbG family)
MKKKYITAAEFDERFDAGEDLSVHYDLENAVRPGLEQRRVSVDFPVWMVQRLDRVARRLGVTRQSVIKVFISEKLKEESL